MINRIKWARVSTHRLAYKDCDDVEFDNVARGVKYTKKDSS